MESPMAAQPARAPTPQSSILSRETLGGIALLTLNRPAARNSLSEAMIADLHTALNEIAKDNDIRALVIAGNGPAFCAGHDLKQLTARRTDADGGKAYFRHIMTSCSAMMQAIVNLPKPVIAAVQGIATAAGCQLVASCDMAVASDDARFATSGIDNGLFCSTPMVALSRNVSRKHAMEMLLLGEMIPAEQAAAYGLVNRVVPDAEVLKEAIALATKVAAKSPLTVATGKVAFYKQAEMPLSEAYTYATRVMVENMLARDAEEGIGAFLEKRKPEWTGR